MPYVEFNPCAVYSIYVYVSTYIYVLRDVGFIGNMEE